jgi:hypothetical protein
LDSTFGAVVAGPVDGVIELQQRIGGPMAVHEFSLKVSQARPSLVLQVAKSPPMVQSISHFFLTLIFSTAVNMLL